MRAKGIILAVAGVTGVAFGLAWWFRYEPLPPGGYVWDRWTRQMCQSESLSKGQGCNYEIALAEYERKTMECLAMLNAIGAPLRQDAAKLIQAGFSVSEVTKWAVEERATKTSDQTVINLMGTSKRPGLTDIVTKISTRVSETS